MLSPGFLRAAACFVLTAGLAACGASTSGTSTSTSAVAAISEVSSRENQFPDYPVVGRTYLSFNHAHGYQVNYIGAGGKAWLWYPGNPTAVPEEWKLDTVAGQRAVCWRHPSNSYNPVTKQTGGAYSCQSLNLSQKSTVASLKGDPFNLRSGAVPHRLARCAAPEEFEFDRARYRC